VDSNSVEVRIARELAALAEGGQEAELVPIEGNPQRYAVIYRAVPTAGAPLGLPAKTDVIVVVPAGYPAAVIDLAGLPVGSVLLPRLRGGGNSQGQLAAAGQSWQLASYHPHSNGGGEPYDPIKHGFHTYFQEVLAWLAVLA
jgi:hypothetical protein